MDTTHIPQTTLPGAKTPEKYIRTLEGDIEAVKKGIVPNLSPLKAPPPPASATPAATPPPPPLNVPQSGTSGEHSAEQNVLAATTPPPPPPIPKPLPAPKPEPPPPLPPPPQKIVEAREGPSPIETYAGDFSQKVKDTHASTATVLAAEQDALTGTPQKTVEKSSRGNTLYVIAGATLLLLGIAGAYIAYTRYVASREPVALAPALSAPIFFDEKERIAGTGPREILQAIEQSLLRPLAPHTVRFLYTDSATTTGESVFSALQLPAPGVLLRNVDSARSMAGIVGTGSESPSSENTQSPFFILSVASYGDTFAGMLSWEPTLPRDMRAIFPSFAEGSGGQAASSTLPVTPSFRDEVAGNHDVRIYRDLEGRSVLVYGYWNRTTLVIARDPSAFIEILGRLATARTPN